MPEHKVKAGEVYETEEVLDVVFPAGHKATEVVHPGEEPFDLPPPAVAAQLASILGLASAPAVGSDQFDAVRGGELFVEPVGVVGFVADEPGGELVQEACGQNLFHKLALGW